MSVYKLNITYWSSGWQSTGGGHSALRFGKSKRRKWMVGQKLWGCAEDTFKEGVRKRQRKSKCCELRNIHACKLHV